MKTFFVFYFSTFCVMAGVAQVNEADRNAALQLVSGHKAALGLSTDDLSNLVVSDSYQDNSTGIRYVYLQQTYLDIPVYNQIQVVTFRNNQLLSHAGGRIDAINQKVNVTDGHPVLSAESAVTAALKDRKLESNQKAIAISRKHYGRFVEFGNMGLSQENITARLMWVPEWEGKSLKLAWQVYIIPATSSDYWLVRIDATNGKTLGADNLTVYCSWDDPGRVNIHSNPKHEHPGNITENRIVHDQLPESRTTPDSENKTPASTPLADNAGYRVIPFPYEAPSFMPGPSASWHDIRNNPWTAGSANATTLKWHSTAESTTYSYTRGNNVWAYHDRTNLNAGDSARSATSTTAVPNLTFNFTPDYTLEPTVTSPPNQQFNITNLFYWNNIIHDVMYNYGFNEPGGNFQNNNLGRGGLGSDHVRAEAQDGSGSNNANFSTPADGSPPRMQMYLWTSPAPDRDGDTDNGIIVHEYGHGISNRLTGGPSTTSCLGNAEQMGEGWSDYFCLMFTQDWAGSNLNTGFNSPRGIGTYARNEPTTGAGIRTQKYCTDFSVNNRVYAPTLSTSSHNRGEIWCATLWDMTWNIIQQVGAINPDIYNVAGGGGNTIALRLVTEGLKLQPCSPGFIDGKNAILQADQNLFGGAYQCAIKEAFRRRGMGDGASQGSSLSISDQVPGYINGSLTLRQNGVSSASEGQHINYTNRMVVGDCYPLTNYLITDTLPSNVSFVSAGNGGTYNPANRVVSWVVNQAINTTVDYNCTVSINTGAYFATTTSINESLAGAGIPGGWSATAVTGPANWVSSATTSHSAPNALFAEDNAAAITDFRVATTIQVPLGTTPPTLSFWHSYNLETGWDGGVVEMSIDNGTIWTDLGTYMTQNKYSGSVGTGNPINGRGAFTGNSNGWIQTRLRLLPTNQNALFRFRMTSDDNTAASGTNPGWYVDDILLQNIAEVNMRSSLFNASLSRQQYSDSLITITPPFTPSNDNAPGAVLLTVGSGCSGSPYTNFGSTQSGSEPFAACKGAAGYKTVWYKFNAPASGNIRVSTDFIGGTLGADSRLALFSAEDVNNYATFSHLACDDDNGTTVAARSILYATGLTPGNTYYIQVDGKDGSTAAGTFCIAVDEMASSMLAASTACAAGQPLAGVNDNYTGWVAATDVNGKLVALISNPAGGATTSTYEHALNINAGPVRQDANGTYYLDRNFSISNASVANAMVQFFFLNAELTMLQASDPAVTLAQLQVTRQTGTVCDNNFIAANGSNTSVAQTGNGSGAGFSWIQVQTPGFSKFYLHTGRAFIPLKTFLQGAFAAGPEHKNVSAAWASVLNAHALNQPYAMAPFNYTGTESVSPGFFTSSAAATDIVDWVLVEIRDNLVPSAVIARRAAFIREDGLIKDLNGISDLSFRTLAAKNYHVVIGHRNHLPIRTSSVIFLDGALGYLPALKNFSLAQAQAYQDPAVTTNSAQRDLGGGVFGLWGGNGNSNTSVRANGALSLNDYLFLLTNTLGGNVSAILSSLYNNGDLNMDGQARASGVLSVNDYLFLVSAVLGGDASKIITQHQ